MKGEEFHKLTMEYRRHSFISQKMYVETLLDDEFLSDDARRHVLKYRHQMNIDLIKEADRVKDRTPVYREMNIANVLKLGDMARYHEDSVYMGFEKQANPAYTGVAHVQPQYFYRAAWMLEYMGSNIGLEQIDSSHTTEQMSATMYEITGNGWSLAFRFIGRTFHPTPDFIFMGKGGDISHPVFYGDYEAFQKEMMLHAFFLPERVGPSARYSVSDNWEPVSIAKVRMAG